MKTFYLGVEGGATKSMAILAHERGVIAQLQGKTLNYNSATETIVKKNLAALLGPLLKKAKQGKLCAVFGLAGLDTKRDAVVYRRIIKSLLPKNTTFQAINDANIALEAKCPGERNRILVISGTGSTVVAESEGQEAKAVGWDFILGDEGSGYEMGLKVMKAAVQSWDGRIKKTLLENLLLAKTHSQTMEDFIPTVYHIFHAKTQEVKDYIASFAPLADEALSRHDWRALQIREETSQELFRGVKAVIKRLELENKDCCVGLVGSVWKMPGLEQLFKEKIKQQFLRVRFSDKKESGAWGAVLLAKKLCHMQ